MSTEIRAIGMDLTDSLRAHVRNRLGFALARFGTHMRKVSVRFVASGGHWICRVTADTQHAGRLAIEDQDHDPYAAASRAIGRLGRTMARAVERTRMAG